VPRRSLILGAAALIAAGAVASTASAGLIGGSSVGGDPSTYGTIGIAMEGPLTGAQASNGQDMLRGVQLAALQVNKRGGVLGRQVRIVGVDDQADPALAGQAVRESVAAGAAAVIGPYNSSVGLKNLGLYEDERIVPMRMTSDNRTEGYGATLQPMNSQISPVEVDFISGQGYRSVVMLVDPSAYTKSIAERTASGLEKAGVTVTRIMIPPSASDYSAEVSQALALNPDLVYSATYYPEGVIIAAELAAANSNAQCFMNLANVDQAFIQEAGVEVSQQCIFSGVPAAAQLPDAGSYVAAYRKAFGVQPDVWGAFTYDSAWVLFHAMEEVGSTRYGAVLQGATGTIDIRSKTGNRAHAPVYILAVDDAGDFVIVQ